MACGWAPCCDPSLAPRLLGATPSSGPVLACQGAFQLGAGGWLGAPFLEVGCTHGQSSCPSSGPSRPRFLKWVTPGLQKEPVWAGTPAWLRLHLLPKWGDLSQAGPPLSSLCLGTQELAAFCHRPQRLPSVKESSVSCHLFMASEWGTPSTREREKSAGQCHKQASGPWAGSPCLPSL